MFLLNEWILPTVGVASEMVFACSLHSRLVCPALCDLSSVKSGIYTIVAWLDGVSDDGNFLERAYLS